MKKKDIEDFIGDGKSHKIFLTDGGIIPYRNKNWRMIAFRQTGKQIKEFLKDNLFKEYDRYYSTSRFQGVDLLAEAWGFRECESQPYLTIDTGIIILVNRIDDRVIQPEDSIESMLQLFEFTHCICG